MFDSPWLDVAIGVVFVWFVFSLSVSFANELLTQLFATRSKQLWKTLSQMLDGNNRAEGLFKTTFKLLFWPGRPASPTPGPGADISQRVYATQSVQALENRPSPGAKTRISNLPAPVFAQALFELAHGATGTMDDIKAYIDGLPDDKPLKKQLQALVAEAGTDVKELRARIEAWFDAQMSRLSAIYKAQARVILVPIGIIFACLGFSLGLRTDAIGLTTQLQHDANYRSAVVAAADAATKQDLVKAGCPKADPKIAGADKVKCEITGVSKIKDIDLVLSTDAPDSNATRWERAAFLNPFKHWRPALGVLITGIAISLGSTFWFDLLKRMTGLRKSST